MPRQKRSFAKGRALLNFKKARSLLEKVIRMVEEDRYCIDVMQQNLAVLGLLKAAHQMLMEGHLRNCFRRAFASRNEKRKTEMIREILRVTSLFNR